MRDEQLQLIREKVIAANPPLHWERYSVEESVFLIAETTFRLADVLLATQRHDVGQWWFEKRVIPIVDVWNLRKDNLTEQSDETISFLADLLK